MFPRRTAEEESSDFRVTSWGAKLAPGYYRLHVASKPFENAQVVEKLDWDNAHDFGDSVHVRCPLGNMMVPPAWKGMRLWIRIETISEPEHGAVVQRGGMVRGSHHCPWSPDRRCYHDDDKDPNHDDCVFCGHPEERK